MNLGLKMTQAFSAHVQGISDRPTTDQMLAAAQCFNLGVERVDDALGEGLTRGSVHEIYLSRPKDVTSAFGFTLALALRTAGRKPILVSQQDVLDAETGALNASGLAELGLDPSRIILVRTRDAEGVLRAGEQAARCTALGAVVIETWGEPKILNFTASRRLALAAAKSNVPIFLVRAAASPSQSAASTRWSVRSAPSRPLEANAPGFPAFDLTLLRHRGGMAGSHWCVEWNRDRKCFQERERGDVAPISRPMVSVPASRPHPSQAPLTWRAVG
ncbi:MAG: ImuA family protein [Hyphomicrobium sp.]